MVLEKMPKRTGAGEEPEAEIVGELIAAAFHHHAAALYRVAFRATRDADVAEDVTQDAFVRLIRFSQEGLFPENVAAWLHRTAMNLVISQARRAAVARRAAPRLVRQKPPADPAEVAVTQEERNELDATLATLSPAHRLALVLAAGGATGHEMAVEIGRSQLATRALLCRARRQLRLATAAPRAAP